MKKPLKEEVKCCIAKLPQGNSLQVITSKKFRNLSPKKW